MKLIDTHAHVYVDQFKKDRDEVIQKSFELGLEKIIMPNIDATTIDSMMEVEEKYPGQCIATMGLHPCSVGKNFEKELYLVEDWLSKRHFIAVGEIGTDLYWDKTYYEQQKEALEIQLNLAKKYKVPVIIHCRDSIDETIEIVENLNDEHLTGVFHCFGGTVDQGNRIVDLGFYLGLGGVTTFKNAGMDKVIPELDEERIILETDSPYLAPVPHRGKRNEPAYTRLVAERVASIKDCDADEVAEKTTENTLKLFNLN